MSSTRDFMMFNPFLWGGYPRRGFGFDTFEDDSDVFDFPQIGFHAPHLTTPPMEVSQVHRHPRGVSHRPWTHHQAGGFVKMEKKPNGDLLIKSNIPGVDLNDIKLELKQVEAESVLNLTIQKHEDVHSTDKWGATFTRTSHFNVFRSIPLGALVTESDISANFENGCLQIEVEMPRSLKDKTASRIDIQQCQKSVSDESVKGKGGKSDASESDIKQD